WKRFWSLPIHQNVRSLWYCALHDKLSCRELLHHIMPDIVPSPQCPLCHFQVENALHFLYQYPLKWEVWVQAWSTCFDDPPTELAIHNSIFLLEFPIKTRPPRKVQSSQIISSILLALWLAHWRTVFYDIPFSITLVYKLFQTIIDQIAL
ncbi:hypothetical protein CLU79DRAFT_707530, partial [Phycomyces nitens]